MKHKLLFVVCLLFNFCIYSQTFIRDYSNPTATYQLKMDFSPQSWGDVYLDIEVKNTGNSGINTRNAKLQFLSDATPNFVNFTPNGSISYPTVTMTHLQDGSQFINTLNIGLPEASWVDHILSPNESFKLRVDLRTVTSSYSDLADSIRFYTENGAPSLFTDVTTTVTGNDANAVMVNYKNTSSNTLSTETITTSAISSLRIDQPYQIWANSFVVGTTQYISAYEESSPLSFIPSETNTNITIGYTKSTIRTENVTINVIGLPSGVSAPIALKNNDINGADKNTQITNGSNSISQVLEGNYAVTISAYTDNANNLIYTPQYTANFTVATGNSNTLAVSFTASSVHEFTVKGFPKYLSHGTITNAAASFDDNFKNSPLNALFKYSGLDGAGDRGKIPDMTPTKNTIEQARRLEASQGGRKILPVMVHYTANASGGGSLEAIKDLSENQNLYFHYRNLIQEIKVILSYEDTDHPNPGAFVISPDLIGAIQQDVVFGNDHNIRTMRVEVNQDIKKAFEDENLNITGLPSFSDNLKGYLQSVNFLIHHVGECKIPFGYQQNVWAAGSARWVFEKAGEFNDPVSEAIEVADFMNSLELYTGEWKPDFIAFDRYERDCFGPAAIQNYAWTAKHWDMYLIFCEEIAERIGNVPIMLWQIPGGHMPTTDENIVNFDIANHSSASAPYFLGDSRIGTDLSKIHPDLKNIALALPHYEANTIGGHLANDNGYDWGTSNLQRLANMNVFSILWGGGSTTGIGSIGTNGDDDQWLAKKISEYYSNAPVYKTVAITPYQNATYCQNGVKSSLLPNENNKELQGIKIFPSPAKDQLQISSSVSDQEYMITIFDIYGKKVGEYKNRNGNSIDVSNLSKGAYIIKLHSRSEEGSISKIFYKE
ncbi:T9SS type A sorting domain-containing protein [Aquimarina macrocephali]|uniref:T9SS type A sorting domain-containing protein n=1 Tax=Aquimarina macrocephali TaxID=666563 RepID=UPI0009FEEBC9|nr:T9SS type A sorting domain-containing protein [Aquimarina macrocephali]